MKLFKKGDRIWLQADQHVYHIKSNWDDLVNRKKLHIYLSSLIPDLEEVFDLDEQGSFDPPIGSQEVWAAGVTYLRSKVAREKESAEEGGSSFYDKVYNAERPELFFKSQSYRASGHLGDVHIRHDSTWDVPEPELTLFACSEGTIEGYTIGNDMSSRSIEGQNPLYLAQAKIYDHAAALGPCLTVLADPLPLGTAIQLKIYREETLVFDGMSAVSQIKRDLTELVSYLFRETTFQQGVMLMTGTGIIPPDDFTLKPADRVEIYIDHIGTLINYVTKR
jgi:2-dehydro-3-deoxy-D-arabinonate dehydratase